MSGEPRATARRPVVLDFLQHAASAPDSALLWHRETTSTYGGVAAHAQGIAAWLRARGVARGDRVALALPNGHDYVTTYFGVQIAGGCAVTLDAGSSGEELAYALNHSGAVIAAFAAPALQKIRETRVPVPALRGILAPQDGDVGLRHVAATSLAEARAATPLPFDPPSPGDLAQIIYTSGTTGRPKGVVLSHQNLAANTRSILATLPIRESGSVFVILPFSYSYGNSLLLTHAASGGRLVVASDFVFWNDVLDVMERERVAAFAGIPSSFAMLMQRSDFLKRPWPDLRYATCAGGGLPASLVARFRSALPHVALHLMYGQTEASARLTCLPAAELDRRAGSAGRAIPDVSIEIRGDDGVVLPPGETGEIVARGENVMVGYWDDPESTARVLHADGLHTGDRGHMDRDGFVYIEGRADDVIKSGGYRIGPQEIEDAILEVDGVLEVGVTGIPDEILGSVPVAYVVARASVDDLGNRIRLHLRSRLPRHKHPKSIHFVPGLPRTANGKLQRRRLGQ